MSSAYVQGSFLLFNFYFKNLSKIQSLPSEKKAMFPAFVILLTAASGRRTSPTCVVPQEILPCSVMNA